MLMREALFLFEKRSRVNCKTESIRVVRKRRERVI